MSDLTYYDYPGVGQLARNLFGYSQAVRVGDRIELSGQGGWYHDLDEVVLPETVKEQIDLAFKNIDVAIKHAGGKGVTQVYRITSYHIDMSPEVLGYMKESMEKWMPDHKPVWTAVGQVKLGMDRMLVEIEAVAYDPQPGP